MVSQKQLLGLLSLLLLGSTLSAQCINDQCGDIFADWALLSEETTVCEGATFEVANQTLTPGIDFYVWDWGNGDRDTVYEVANYFYTYLFDEATACATSNEFIIYSISLEIYRYCDEGMSCHTQIAPVAIRFKPRASFSLPAILCAGDTVPATNLSCNADTYEWIFSDGTTSDEMHPQHVFDTAGVYDVTLVVSNGCGTDTVTQSVEVLPKPVAAGGLSDESSAIGCAPLTVAFTNASEFADGFNWIFPDSAGVVFLDTFTQQSAAPVVEFTQPGTFTVRMEAGNECGFQEWTTTIEVVAPPQVTLEPLPAACETASLQLGDYLSYSGDIDTFHWTVQGPETPSLPDSPSPLLTVSTPGDYTIALTVSSDYCPAAFDSTDLQIQTPEVLTLTPPAVSALCDASDPVSFTATPAGGAWQGPGVDSTGLFDPGQAGVGTHTLTYQYGSGACLLVDSLSVTVLDAPEVTAAPNLDLCETGSPVQLDFSPAGGNWSGPGIVDATQGLFDPLSSGPGDFSLTYTLIAANQCELRQTTEVTVQPLPEVMAPDTSAFCVVQTTINLGAELQPTFDPAGGTINWSGPGITDSLQGIFVHDGTEGIYPVQIQYAFDFCTAGETIYVSIVDPEAAAVGPDRTACLNDGQLTLTGSPAGGRWTGPGLMDEFSGEVDLAAAGAGDHVYRYTLAGGTSCEVRDELTLTIVGPTNLEAGPDQIFCADESQATLPVATPAGGQWSGPGLLDATTGALILDQLPPDADYTYAYTINDSSGCTFADSVQVRVNGLPAAAFALPDYSCVTAPLTFATSEEEAVTYQWDFGDGEQAVGHEVSYSYPAAGTYAVILEATNAAGCNRTATDELTIATIPQPRFEPATDDGCGPLTVQFADASAGTDLTYDWDFGNGTSSTDAVPPPAIYAAGIFDTTYHVRLELSNACGADSWVDTITVRARPVANFGTLVNTGCGPLEVALANTTLGSAQSYFWDFGNGQTATDSLPAPPVLTTPDTAATIYTITLQASNTCGTDTIQRQVTVVPSNVTAFFNTDQTQGCAPLAVNLTSFATYGTSVTWNFGDGVTGSGAAVSHTFDSAGLYTVFQYVENACGRDSLSQLIEVFPAPMALFDHPSVVCADQPTAFNNLSGEYQTMLWDFGDG
ncbi:MAG: PKD domain-containing protein [Lewinella sp.]|nr:PKD domain-containing protein [Lewinella sp.]